MTEVTQCRIQYRIQSKQQYVTEKVFMHTKSRSLKGSMRQKSRQISPTEVGSTKQQYVTEKVLSTLRNELTKLFKSKY